MFYTYSLFFMKSISHYQVYIDVLLKLYTFARHLLITHANSVAEREHGLLHKNHNIY